MLDSLPASSEPLVERARMSDIPALSALNNRFAPEGLTLPRNEAFVAGHINDYRLVRDGNGGLLGCVALDEYSPSLVELVSLAVAPEAQGQGLGKALIDSVSELARVRGYPQIFAVSFADRLFLGMGFTQASPDLYPEKIARYARVSRSELSMTRKFLFSRTFPVQDIETEAPVFP